MDFQSLSLTPFVFYYIMERPRDRDMGHRIISSFTTSPCLVGGSFGGNPSVAPVIAAKHKWIDDW